MRKSGIIVLLFGALLGAVNAEIITIQVTATVSVFDDNGPSGGYFDGGIVVGDTLVMTYSYDTETPNSNPYSPPHPYGNNGIYNQSVPNVLTVTVGSYTFQSDINNFNYYIALSLYGTSDTYYVCSTNNKTDVYSGNFLMSWQLDYSSDAFLNADLPTTVPDIVSPSDWGIRIDGERDFYIQAIPTSVEIIPEPITILTFSLGSLIVFRNRKISKGE